MFRTAASFPWIGEASTMYLVSKSAPAEINEFSPGSRILVMVRDPVEAMYSMHAELLKTSSEDISDFSAALDAERHRGNGNLLPRYGGYREQSMYRHQYRYVDQIVRYVDQFTWGRVHVVVYDDLKADPDKVYQKVLAFLGVQRRSLPEYPRVNVSGRRRFRWLYLAVNSIPKWYRRVDSNGRLLPQAFRRGAMRMARGLECSVNVTPYRRPPLPVELERRLRQEFAPEVERLSSLLGRDLSHWSRMPEER